MLYAMLECIYERCGRRLTNKPAPLTVEDIVLAMELLPRDQFKKVLKYYIRARSERELCESQSCCCLLNGQPHLRLS